METPSNPAKPDSRYQKYLPALLQGDPVVNQFLWAFEMVLSGGTVNEQSSFQPKIFPRTQQGSQTPLGLEEVIRHIHLYFNPDEGKTPAEFLPWLASWVALSLREDWDEDAKRQFIRQIVPLYQKRGTKAGMKEVLELYLIKSLKLKSEVTVYDEFEHYPNYFQVQLTLPKSDQNRYWQQVRIAKAIIEQEKPAHTYYALRILTPTMRLTGKAYPLSFPDPIPSEISIKVEKQSSTPDARLRLSIKAKGIIQPLEATISEVTSIQTILQVTLDLTKLTDSLTLNQKKDNWYVLIDNLSSETFQGTLTVTGASVTGTDANSSITIEPGLRIIKQHDGKITDPNGNINGNTHIGTEVGN